MAFGGRCLNCADDYDFARECHYSYLNRSGIINLDISESTADEVATLWSRDGGNSDCASGTQTAGRPTDAETTEAATERRLTCRYHRGPLCSVLSPFFPLPDATRTGGGPHKRSAYEDGGEALLASQDVQKRLAGATAHNLVPSQEAGCNLPVSGKSGSAVG